MQIAFVGDIMPGRLVGEAISTRMQALSSELGTVVQRRGRWLEVRLERQEQLARAACTVTPAAPPRKTAPRAAARW